MSTVIDWAKKHFDWEPKGQQEQILSANYRMVYKHIPRREGKTEVMVMWSLYKCLTEKNYEVLILAETQQRKEHYTSRILEVLTRSEKLVKQLETYSRDKLLFKNGSSIVLSNSLPIVRSHNFKSVLMEDVGSFNSSSVVSCERVYVLVSEIRYTPRVRKIEAPAEEVESQVVLCQ